MSGSNALYSSGCSQAKFLYVHATLVYFTVKELGYQLELEGVLRVVPTDLGSIVDFCADMDDHRLAEESKGVSAAFALSDKGDQAAGTSKNALTHNMATGYDHATGAPWGPVHLSAMEIERGGAAIAQSIQFRAGRNFSCHSCIQTVFFIHQHRFKSCRPSEDTLGTGRILNAR